MILAWTQPTNPLTAERIFAIVIAAGAWFIIGTVVERLRSERDEN